MLVSIACGSSVTLGHSSTRADAGRCRGAWCIIHSALMAGTARDNDLYTRDCMRDTTTWDCVCCSLCGSPSWVVWPCCRGCPACCLHAVMAVQGVCCWVEGSACPGGCELGGAGPRVLHNHPYTAVASSCSWPHVCYDDAGGGGGGSSGSPFSLPPLTLNGAGDCLCVGSQQLCCEEEGGSVEVSDTVV